MIAFSFCSREVLRLSIGERSRRRNKLPTTLRRVVSRPLHPPVVPLDERRRKQDEMTPQEMSDRAIELKREVYDQLQKQDPSTWTPLDRRFMFRFFREHVRTQ